MKTYTFKEAYKLMLEGYKFRFLGRREIVYVDNDELVEELIIDHFHKLSHRTILCQKEFEEKEKRYTEGIIISKIK